MNIVFSFLIWIVVCTPNHWFLPSTLMSIIPIMGTSWGSSHIGKSTLGLMFTNSPVWYTVASVQTMVKFKKCFNFPSMTFNVQYHARVYRYSIVVFSPLSAVYKS